MPFIALRSVSLDLDRYCPMMQGMVYKIFAISLLALSASPLAAQQVHNCFDAATPTYPLAAEAIAEPWEENTRRFANGQLRISIMDTYEPALGAFGLLIFFEPLSESPEPRACVLVSNGSIGFVDMTLVGLEAEEIPDIGMVFSLPTVFYNPATDETESGTLEVMVDRVNMDVKAERR